MWSTTKFGQILLSLIGDRNKNSETICYAIRMTSSQEPEGPSLFERDQFYRAHSI